MTITNYYIRGYLSSVVDYLDDFSVYNKNMFKVIETIFSDFWKFCILNK